MIKDVITVRRVFYLHTILARHNDEPTKKIYKAMKDDPIREDWIHLVQIHIRDIDLNMSDDFIGKLSRQEFKKIIQEKVR